MRRCGSLSACSAGCSGGRSQSPAQPWAGCFYTAPINRQPKVFPPQRVCDAAHPADPCTPENVHLGDHVLVKAVFSDPDGDVNAGTVQWRISACDGTTTNCDTNRLHDDTVPELSPYAEFTVPPALTASGLPARNIVLELTVYDDRGVPATSVAGPVKTGR